MTLRNSFKVLFFVAVLMGIVLIGCRKPESNSAQKGVLGLHLHTYVDTNTFQTGLGSAEYTQEFPDHNGRWMNITTANMYITNVSLHSSTSGNWYAIPGSIMMKRMENEVYIIDSVPTDTYDNVRFTVGLGSVLNGNAPSTYSTSSGPDTVLSTTESMMYAGSGKGYYFLYLAGNIDTSSAHNLNHPIPFIYQIAGDTVQVTPPTASGGNKFSIIPTTQFGGPQYVHIIIDYGRLLQSFPITSPTNVNTFTNPVQATPVLDSIPAMFRYECSVPNGDC